LEITSRIAEFITGTNMEDFPPEAVVAAKGAIMDCLACTLAGSGESLAEILCQYARTEGGQPIVSVLGQGFKTSATNAALVNGALAHALDYDDITHMTKTHPTAVILPAALAAAEETGGTLRDVLLGYMVGFEVACAVGETLSEAYYDDLGWHPTGPLGSIAAAAAVSQVIGLDRERSAMAISLAASQASGLRQNFGTMTKPFHAGAAARVGVMSARLVQSGFTAGQDALEGRFGFIRAFSGGKEFNDQLLLDNLGQKSYLIESGIEIKKYPCCGSAHLALDATFELLSNGNIDPTTVDNIQVMVDFDPPRSLIHARPTSALEGKFSMQYCLSAALLDRKVGLQSFTDEQVMRPEAQTLIPKITMSRFSGNEGKASWSEGYNEVAIHLKDGQVLQHQARRANSGALRGVTVQDIRDKFIDCAATVLSAEETGRVLTQLDSMESDEPVNTLTDLLRADR